MRNLWYLLSSLSCAVLTAVFYTRRNFPLAALLACVSLFYLYRVFVWGRREKKREMRRFLQTPPLDDKKKEELRRELLDTRTVLIRNRNVLFIVVTGILTAAVLSFSQNAPLAVAILLFLLPALYLMVRNIRAIGLIERGLGLKKNRR